MDPELGIVIPAFNESDRLAGTLAEILRTLDAPHDEALEAVVSPESTDWRPGSFEIVVVDDGSTDDTARIVETLGDPRVSCLRLPVNRGKGAAVRAGLEATAAEWVLVCDADSSTPFSELGRLVRAARTTGSEIVVGSRADASSRIGRHQPRSRELLGQSYNRLLRGLGLTELRDTQCGFKLLRGDLARALASRLTIDGFAFDVELLWLARQQGATPVSVGVRWDHDDKTHVRMLRDGGRMVLDALRIRWPGLVRHRTRIAAVALLAVTLLLQAWAIDVHSLTGDGAYHLVAGHQALRYGTNTVNLEHPPLAKLAMALPSLAWEPLAPPIEVDRAVETAIGLADHPVLMRKATLAGRYVVLTLFILPLLWACIRLGSRWGGAGAGLLLGAMVMLSFPVVGTLSVLQTDAAVTLGFVLVALAALRFIAAPSLPRVLTLGAGLGLAMAVKFSGALLAPTVLLALGIGLWRARRGVTGRDRVALWALPALPLAALAATLLVLECSFALANLDYDPELGRAAIQAYIDGEGLITGASMQAVGPWLMTAERYDPGVAQWLAGFFAVREQNTIGVYPSYAFGVVTSAGRWWYHPVVFLLKTPLVILFAAAGLAVAWLPGERSARHDDACDAAVEEPGSWDRPGAAGAALIALTVAVYLATAMTSNYNLGYRHLLPILPFLYLPVAALLVRRPLGAMVLVAVLALECFAVGPLWASSTNTWWLGSRNPTRFVLGNGNLSFGQSLVLLDREMRRLGLADLGVVDPVYRPETLAAYAPGIRAIRPGDPIGPGWYAVEVTLEQFVPALLGDGSGEPAADDSDRPYLLFADALRAEARRWAPVWRDLVRRGEDHGYIAGTYHLYLVPTAAGAGEPTR